MAVSVTLAGLVGVALDLSAAFVVGLLVVGGLVGSLVAVWPLDVGGEYRELERRHAELLVTDRLTGLLSRQHFMDRAEVLLEETHLDGHTSAVFVVDVDRFRSINDRQGHRVGDLVLAQVAERVRTTLRDGDLVGRYGGDELVALLPDTDIPTARRLARAVSDAVRGLPIDLGTGITFVTISVGVATTDGDTALDDLLAAADRARSYARRKGRSRALAAAV